MKYFRDGDQFVITQDDFIDLQSSPAIFVPVQSRTGEALGRGGILALPIGDLILFRNRLQSQRLEGEGVVYPDQALARDPGDYAAVEEEVEEEPCQ